MEKEFLNYELSLKMKELGFEEECFGFYWHDTKQLVYENAIGNHHGVHLNAPTFSQAFRWFRNTYRLDCAVIKHTGFKSKPYTLDIVRKDKDYYHEYDNDEDLILHITYEEAELAGLTNLIEIIKG